MSDPTGPRGRDDDAWADADHHGADADDDWDDADDGWAETDDGWAEGDDGWDDGDDAVDGPYRGPERRRADRPAAPVALRAERRRDERRRRIRRRRLAVVGVVVALPLVLVAVAVVWYLRQLDPGGEPGPAVAVNVQSGWSVDRIADELEEAEVVGSALAFRIYARTTGAGPFQAGEYRLAEGLGVRAAAEALEAGPEIEYQTLRLPPGLWLPEIAARVGELPGRSAERFLQVAQSGVVRSKYQPPEVTSLEGLLFPDTYFVLPTDDEETILRRLVARFDEVADEIGMAERAPALGITPYQAAVVASLIQQEARLDEERPVIAGVVYNRLRDGMMLQIDATVLYAIGERKPSNTAEDRATDSPFNTYRVTGLPPTPISSVARTSLEAALAPADVPYRFYVLADEDGRHAFAETFAEHQRNVEAARERGLLG